MHTHIHPCMYTYVHTMQMYIHKCAEHTCTWWWLNTDIHVYTYMDMYTYVYACTCTYMNMYVHLHAHTNMYTHASTHIYTCTHMHVCIRARRYTHSCMYRVIYNFFTFKVLWNLFEIFINTCICHIYIHTWHIPHMDVYMTHTCKYTCMHISHNTGHWHNG